MNYCHGFHRLGSGTWDYSSLALRDDTGNTRDQGHRRSSTKHTSSRRTAIKLSTFSRDLAASERLQQKIVLNVWLVSRHQNPLCFPAKTTSGQMRVCCRTDVQQYQKARGGNCFLTPDVGKVVSTFTEKIAITRFGVVVPFGGAGRRERTH